MFIQAIPSGPFETNAYVVACEDTLQAAIIDPAPDSADSIISLLEDQNFKPVNIILTHSHWDHIADVSLLQKKYHIPVLIHSLETGNLEKPGSDKLP